MKKTLYLLDGSIGVGKTTIINKIKEMMNTTHPEISIIEEFNMEDPLIQKIIRNSYGEQVVPSSLVQDYMIDIKVIEFMFALDEFLKDDSKSELWSDRTPFDPWMFWMIDGGWKEGMDIPKNYQLLLDFIKEKQNEKYFEIVWIRLRWQDDLILESIKQRNRNGEVGERLENVVRNWNKASQTIYNVVYENSAYYITTMTQQFGEDRNKPENIIKNIRKKREK